MKNKKLLSNIEQMEEILEKTIKELQASGEYSILSGAYLLSLRDTLADFKGAIKK